MRKKKIYDWSQIEKIPAAERKGKICEAFSHYLKQEAASPIQMYTVEGEKMRVIDPNLSGQAPIVLVMSDQTKTPDRGYELLFKENDLRASTNNTFEVLDVSGGVTFYQHTPGQEATLTKIPSAAVTVVPALRFTGGFPILDDWLRYNQYYKIDELTADTERGWYKKKATYFYGLLAALSSGINESFATDDVTTINNACAQIYTDLEAAGYQIDEDAMFYITCHPKLRGRILKALASTFINPNTNNNEIAFNIAGVINTSKVANTSYYVSLPGLKTQRGEWEDLNAHEPQRNELLLGADHVWTGSYNGIIGESKQHRRCALS
jgi:hypothetical protein